MICIIIPHVVLISIIDDVFLLVGYIIMTMAIAGVTVAGIIIIVAIGVVTNTFTMVAIDIIDSFVIITIIITIIITTIIVVVVVAIITIIIAKLMRMNISNVK